MLVLSRPGEDGISTETFEASLSYITANDPKVFVLEMVWKRKVRTEFLSKIAGTLPHYAIWSGVINSNRVMPTSRTRFYIIGVNVTKVMMSYTHKNMQLEI